MRFRRPYALAAAFPLATLGASAITGCKHTPPPSDAPLHVAAAADLSEAFPEIGKAFETATGRHVLFSFGATGLLAKQVEQGAPFDVFAAANISFVEDAIKAGACEADSRTIYAEGRIVLWTKGTGAPAPASLADLTRPEIARIAIANPEHAPYGKAAKQALVRGGVWDAVAKKIVYGENVQQTLQFAQSGNAEVAIIALSLATVSGGHATPIDPSLYEPLNQALVVCHGAPEAKGRNEPDARKFAAFVSSDAGHAILRRYGFVLGSEAPAPSSADADAHLTPVK
jgi:molybdate transport system substrate-binding protein